MSSRDQPASADFSHSHAYPEGETLAGHEPSAGQRLRAAREASGMHIAALAVLLKVPAKKLEALESNRFDLFPDAVFVRALASSVCRTLKIDAGPVLHGLPDYGAPSLTTRGASLNTPFRTPSYGPGPAVWTQISRPAVLTGVFLSLAALVLFFLPELQAGMKRAGAVAWPQSLRPSATAPGSSKPLLPEQAFATAGMQVTSVTAREPTSSEGTTDKAIQLAPTRQLPSAPVALASQEVAAGVGAATELGGASRIESVPALQSSGIVVFSATGPSWVEVTDSRGQVVLRRTLNAGEVVGASGALPLTAVVGRADATQVQIRGQALDMTVLAKNNVARFEVK